MTAGTDALRRIRELGVPGYGDDEVLLMAETLLELAPHHVFDWGTNVGASARIFFETAQAARIPATVHSVELPDDVPHVEHPGHRYAEWLDGLPVDLHRGDGATVSVDLSRRLGRLGSGGAGLPRMPLFFVDGDHHADNVLRELNLIFEHGTAVILIHDTRAHAGLGVRAFLDQHPNFEEFVLWSQAGMTRLWPR